MRQWGTMRLGINLRGDLCKLSDADIASRFETRSRSPVSYSVKLRTSEIRVSEPADSLDGSRPPACPFFLRTVRPFNLWSVFQDVQEVFPPRTLSAGLRTEGCP